MSKAVKTIAIAIFSIVAIICARPAGTYLYYLLNPKPKPWNVEYTKSVHDTLNSLFKPTFTNANQREEAIGCIINKLKVATPNGLEGLSQDSIYKLSYKFGRDCGSSIKNVEATIKWAKDGEDEFRKGFLKSLPDKRISLSVKNKLCDCVITELKTRYPDGLRLPLPNGLMDSVTTICVSQFTKSN